jgi:DNA-binding MarR family transcriptional regulator
MADPTVNPIPTGIPPIPTFSATNPVTASPDVTTMNNFKAANPGLIPNAQDISIMNGAKTPVPMPIVSPTATYEAVTSPSTPLQQVPSSIPQVMGQTSPQTQGLAQTALQTAQDFINKQQVPQAQTQNDTLLSSIMNSLNPTDGSGSISQREMQTRANLGQQYNTVGITQQLATLTPQINAISQQIQANNQQAESAKLQTLQSPIGGIVSTDLRGRSDEIDRLNAIKNLSLSAQSNTLASQALVLQGNLDGASKAIELAITQKFGAEEAALKDHQTALTLNAPVLERANTKALSNQTLLVNAAQADLANKRDLAKSLVSNVNTMITNGMISDPAQIQNAYKLMGAVTDGSMSINDAYKQLGVTQNIQGETTQGVPGSNGVGNPAQRNNNPGNLKNTDGSWQTFATPQLGFEALQKDLLAKMTGATSTGLTANSSLLDFAKKYAPSTDNNDPNAYAANLAKQLGVSTSTPIGTLVPKVAEFAKAIAQNEGYNNPIAKITTNQYGTLANTTFNPNIPVDKNANTYLTTLLTGKMPQAGDIGIFGRTPGATSRFQEIQNRARNLYFEATGQPLPNVKDIQNAQTLINGNNKLVNTLNIADSTVGKNFALAINNIDKNGINQNSQPINAFLDYIKTQMGDPATAQYLAQNATVSNEVSSLLAVKNAGGTTVHDKLESAGLVPKNASEEQQRAVLKTLLQEAENAKNAVTDQTQKLYEITDPLQQNPNNPKRTALLAPTIAKSGNVDLTKFDKKP